MVGFVGNSVVAPILTTLGQQPITINTVTLPAHPGYGLSGGGSVPPKQIADFLEALQQLDQFTEIGHIITGYMGLPEQVEIIATAVTQWTEEQPKGFYIFDPVLGDNDQLYVDPAIAGAMVAKLLPLANIATPNQFELSYLSTENVTDKATAISAAQSLLAAHPNLTSIVATGIACGDERGDLLIQNDGEPLWQPALAKAKNVAGGGDCLTALFTGYLAKGYAVAEAFRLASTFTQKVLAASITSRELALYESLDALAD